jgi:hypothetical protein
MKTTSLHWDFLWWNFSEMTTLVWCIPKLSAFLIFFIQATSYWLVYIIRSLKLDSCDRGTSSTESFGRKKFGFTA